jgi:hypothetical protein
MSTPTTHVADPIDFERSDAEPDEDSRAPLLDQLESFGHHVTELVITRPLVAVGIVLTLGFRLGRLARH